MKNYTVTLEMVPAPSWLEQETWQSLCSSLGMPPDSSVEDVACRLLEGAQGLAVLLVGVEDHLAALRGDQ